MLSEYPWILLQNLNDGLWLIWLALLIGTSVVGTSFLIDSPGDVDKPHGFQHLVQKRKWFRGMLVLLLLLGSVLVMLPDKDQIALLRGIPVCDALRAKPLIEKKVMMIPVE